MLQSSPDLYSVLDGTVASLMKHLVGSIVKLNEDKKEQKMEEKNIHKMKMILGKYVVDSLGKNSPKFETDEKLLNFALSRGLICRWSSHQQPYLQFPCSQIKAFMAAYYISHQTPEIMYKILHNLYDYERLCEPKYFQK